MLSFCKQLNSGIFYVSFSNRRRKVFSDHKEGFKGLSNLKELAMLIHFSHDESDRRTWWGLPWELKVSWKGGSRKSEALFDLPQVIKELDSFEISEQVAGKRTEDSSMLHPLCPMGLEGSHESLKHLRAMHFTVSNMQTQSDCSHFRNLKILCVDRFSSENLVLQTNLSLPTLMRTIYLGSYLHPSLVSEEEVVLAEVLKKARRFPT